MKDNDFPVGYLMGASQLVMEIKNCSLFICKGQKGYFIKYYCAISSSLEHGEWEEIPIHLYESLHTFADQRLRGVK